MPSSFSAAIATRTGPQAFSMFARYSGLRSRPAFRIARLMTFQWISTSRTSRTSSIQREVIHAHGHSGSNQKSTRAVVAFGSVVEEAAISRATPTPGAHSSGAAGAHRGWIGPTHRRRVVLHMAPPNLTRADAQARAALLQVADYAIALDLTDGGGREPGEATFASDVTVRFSCRRPGASSWIDFVGAQVRSATLNGTPLDVSGYREEDGIALPELAADNELRVEAVGSYMNTGEGLHRFVDPVDGSVYLYSQFETADAKRMFACFDQPDLKARYAITVTAPADWSVVSNAAIEETSDGSGGAAVHRFATTELLSTYLVALIAGPYASWHDTYADEGGEIPLGHLLPRVARRSTWTPSACSPRPSRASASSTSSFGVRYPFGKYDQLFVPEFNAGAMENAGAVTFLEDYVFRSRVTRPGVRAACRDRAARDGAHVVRRPRHHALVGRSLAQRVVRDLRVGAVPGGRHRVHRGLDDLRQRREELGLPAGPAALDPPGGRGHPRPAGRRGQLRRDHLRQGRVGAQAARRLRRAGSVPGRAAQLLRPRTRGATPRSAT